MRQTPAKDLFEAAQKDLKRGYTARAGTRLRQAAEAGHAPAQLAYARALFERPDPTRHPGACEWLERAAEQRLPEALYARSAARYGGLCLRERKPSEAVVDLNLAATAGYPAAELALGLAWHEYREEQAQRIAWAWLSRAGAHGNRFARALIRSRQASGMPPPPAEKERVLPDLAAVENAPLKPVHHAPFIASAENGLSALECAWLRMSARNRLRPSWILDPQSGRARPHPIRTGAATFLAPHHLELPALRLMERLASYAPAPLSRGEPLAILRYHRGDQYRPHRDALGPAALAGDPLRGAGDRMRTVLGYLNSPGAGGETVFPNLGLRITPERGRILVFENLNESRQPEPLSLHAGLPVHAGTKWLASLWIRERDLVR